MFIAFYLFELTHLFRKLQSESDDMFNVSPEAIEWIKISKPNYKQPPKGAKIST